MKDKRNNKNDDGQIFNINHSILEENVSSESENIFKNRKNSIFGSALSIENAIQETKPIKFAYKLDNFNSMNILEQQHKLRGAGSKSINRNLHKKNRRRHSKSPMKSKFTKRNSEMKKIEEKSVGGKSVGIFKRTDGFHFYTPKQKMELEQELKKNIEDIIFRRNKKRHKSNFSANQKEESKSREPKISKSRRGSSNRLSMKTIDSNILSQKSVSGINGGSSFQGSVLSRNRQAKKSFFGQKGNKIRNKSQPKTMKVKKQQRSKNYKGSYFRQMAEVQSVKVKSCRNVSSNLNNVN